jgi:hypothetical protein
MLVDTASLLFCLLNIHNFDSNRVTYDNNATNKYQTVPLIMLDQGLNVLQGTIPTELGRLSDLTGLDLGKAECLLAAVAVAVWLIIIYSCGCSSFTPPCHKYHK